MERAIKFRALVQYKGKEPMWIYYKPLTIPHAFYEDTTDCKIIVKDLQFIGLTDKEGKEVYEGDVVEFDRFNYPSPENTTRYVIEWSDKAHGWDLYWFTDDRGRTPYEVSVIGNRWEHPELLKQS